MEFCVPFWFTKLLHWHWADYCIGVNVMSADVWVCVAEEITCHRTLSGFWNGEQCACSGCYFKMWNFLNIVLLLRNFKFDENLFNILGCENWNLKHLQFQTFCFKIKGRKRERKRFCQSLCVCWNIQNIQFLNIFSVISKDLASNCGEVRPFWKSYLMVRDHTGVKSLDCIVSSAECSILCYLHLCVCVDLVHVCIVCTHMCACVGWTLMLVALSLLISSFSFETILLSLNLKHIDSARLPGNMWLNLDGGISSVWHVKAHWILFTLN